jgi:hypothetical protein
VIHIRHPWQGFLPPQYIFAHARFLGIALEPPSAAPGSWTGAGNCVLDPASGAFVLSSRLRTAQEDERGFAVEFYGSGDGLSFEPIHRLHKTTVAALCGHPVHSLEGVQLLRDPTSDNWFAYLSVNHDAEFTWGGRSWRTVLLSAPTLDGTWTYRGCVLDNDQPYDAHHARDASFGIVDGVWLCIYKARDADHVARPGFATSSDGVTWTKHGTLAIDGRPRRLWMNGTFFAGAQGVLFLGLEKPEDEAHDESTVVAADAVGIGHGGGVRDFVGYLLDRRGCRLETVFRSRWTARSPYEDSQHPVLGYMSTVFDPAEHRLLLYLEAIDPNLSRGVGLNVTVERLLVYEVPLA